MKHTPQELQAFVNDPSRNFSKIRTLQSRPTTTVTYNEHEILTGAPYKVVAFNALPVRKYPVEIAPVNVAWITASKQTVRLIDSCDFKTINIGPVPRFNI